MLQILSMIKKLDEPKQFLIISTIINTIYSFIILKVLSFTVLALPFFIMVSFILLSFGALSTEYFKKHQFNTRTLMVQLGAVILFTSLMFPIILGNTQILTNEFKYVFSRFIVFFLLYVTILSPFYFFWGRIEYLSFKLFIKKSKRPSDFYVINLVIHLKQHITKMKHVIIVVLHL